MDSQQTQPRPTAGGDISYQPLPEGPRPGNPESLYNKPPPGTSTLPYHPSPNTYPPPPLPSEAPISSSYPPQPGPPSYIGLPPQLQPQAPPIPNSNTNQPLPPPKITPHHTHDSGHSGHSQGLTHAPPIPIPDPHPSFHPPPQQPTTANLTTNTNFNPPPQPLKTTLASTESALRELVALHRQRAMVNSVPAHLGAGPAGVNGAGGKDVEERLRAQAGVVLGGLEGLRRAVEGVERRGEGQRWRRWVVGGVFASIIPLVKALFRRPKHEDETSNKTEYAFRKSKNLISRILASTHRPGIGTLAFFVFAVLYVFSNEVSLRVARTVSRRLKRLVAKVEDGREQLTEEDLKLLKGWRWRILMWSD